MVNINQFAQTPVQGQVDFQYQGSVVSAAVGSAQAAPLVAGQYVKLVDDGSPLPKVVALAANTESSWGVVTRNLKDADFPANARVEIGLSGTIIYMTAGAAIARGAKIEVVSATTKVITNAGVNPVAGYAFDKATVDGDLIRVYVLSPYNNSLTIADVAGLQASLDGAVKVARVTATLAEINAGKTLVAGVPGKSITVVGITQRVVGAFATTTSVDTQASTAGTKVTTTVLASLTNGNVIVNEDTGVTLGAGWAAPLTAGEGLVVANVGTAGTGGTSITFTVQYTQA